MTLQELEKLIADDKGGTVEYKETTGQRGDACETLCAFLNKDGGTVVFGVTKKGKLTVQEIAKILKKSEQVTRGVLGMLIREEMIEQRVEGKVHVNFLGKAYHQEVGAEVAYTKLVGLSHTRKLNMIQEHLEQHRKIACGQVMELCGVDRSDAKKLIGEVKHMVNIKLVGRGRGAYYEMEN